MNPTHAPTPWKLSEMPGYRNAIELTSADEDMAIAILGDVSKKDAAFIVRAVNSHDALLASLKEYKEAAKNGTDVTLGMARRSKEAISRAEVKQ